MMCCDGGGGRVMRGDRQGDERRRHGDSYFM